MAEDIARPAELRQLRKPKPCPAALVDPSHVDGKPFTFSFAGGRHALIRSTFERLEAFLARTLYRPFMRFRPPSVDYVTVPLPCLPSHLDGVTIAHISDVHHSLLVSQDVIERTVALTNSLHPDVIVLTGDYVTNDATYAAGCARALSHLKAPLGVFAILGNHDYWTDPELIAGELRRQGITVLINEARELKPDLWLVGMDDIWSGRPDQAAAFAGVPDGAAVVMLAHEPDFADEAQGRPCTLQLSGHSHGGQIRLPFTDRPLLPYLAWKYYAGLRRVGDILVYTSRGVGTMQPPFLFTCRPEVGLLRLCAG